MKPLPVPGTGGAYSNNALPPDLTSSLKSQPPDLSASELELISRYSDLESITAIPPPPTTSAQQLAPIPPPPPPPPPQNGDGEPLPSPLPPLPF